MRSTVGKMQIHFKGVPMEFMVFTFDRKDSKISAVQVWGVWRNGKPLDMDYTSTLKTNPEVFGVLPSGRHLMGIEILSAFTTFEGEPPTAALFQEQLPKYVDLDTD